MNEITELEATLSDALRAAAEEGSVGIQDLKDWRAEQRVSLTELKNMLNLLEAEQKLIHQKRKTEEEAELSQNQAREEKWLRKKAILIQQSVHQPQEEGPPEKRAEMPMQFQDPQSLPARPPLPQRRTCLLYTSPSPRDVSLSRMPSSA